MDPADLVALVDRARTLHRAQRWDEAEQAYRLALQAAPGDAGLLRDWAWLLFVRGKREAGDRANATGRGRGAGCPRCCNSTWGTCMRKWDWANQPFPVLKRQYGSIRTTRRRISTWAMPIGDWAGARRRWPAMPR